VPVYADAVADEIAFVIAHADVRFAAVEDQEQIDKIQSVMDRLPKLEEMVYDETRGLRDYDHAHLTPIDDIIAQGRKALADPAIGACSMPRSPPARALTHRSFCTRRAPQAHRRA
jgi:long-chain acyl-CoA synthetase